MDRRTLLRGFLGGSVALAAGGLAAGYALTRDRFEGDAATPPEALAAATSGDLVLVDIRRPDEWARTGLPAPAHGIDMRRDDFVDALLELTGGARDRPVALICARGVRSDRMSARLAEAGFTRIVDVPEGMLGSRAGPGWLERGLPVRRP
ncbi:rhodanese-like domain-containing protein [Jannaschia sp. Os4]|uniref:rhodanese-like domain-containing protein n=1 Tax=Jannaschia sp. Os4 TaxID=2807617 RepID=UPI0019392C5E|nr:rhodanese-like domain-containing protein [Jannaschia sp. Os4]MBM2576449.1 rhodanese-like domain-containing protein [Jannaschia sp. Os4]